MQEARDALGLSGSQKFTASLQDKIANYLLKKAGIEKWRDGKQSKEDLIDNLAEIFPTFPTTDGKTVEGKPPKTPLKTLEELLDQIKNPNKPSELEEGEENGTIVPVPPSGRLSIGKVISGNNVGTGVVINFSGTLMTNAQVIGITNATIGQTVYVEIGGRMRIAELVAMNPTKDIAHIRIRNYDYADLVPINMAGLESDGVPMQSYGYAFGDTLISMPANPTGENNKTVKYTGPGTPPGGLTVYGLNGMATADVNGLKPGMAGGPVLDGNGRLIGLNAASESGSVTARYVPV
ncbi:hypothetical protein D3C71_1181730 [compost metagenome]